MALRIAVVKQDVYDDYWVCPSTATPAEILFSSMMRVGQAGLFIDWGATPIIVKEDLSPECQTWLRKTKDYSPRLWTSSENYRMLKTKPLNELPGQSHKSPGSSEPPGKYAVNVDDIDWGQYDIVISHDISVPARITKKCPKTLWCYMLQEPFMEGFNNHELIEGYDVKLNQKLGGLQAQTSFGEVNFPAAILMANTLEVFMEMILERPSARSGIYPEINMCPERPVKSCPYSDRLEKYGPICLHHQNIKENLTRLYDSKYFIKVGGRYIRGNAIVEAISSGVLVLMNPKDAIYGELIPPEASINSIDDLCQKIEDFENNSELFKKTLMNERLRAQRFVHDSPMGTITFLANKKSSC